MSTKKLILTVLFSFLAAFIFAAAFTALLFYGFAYDIDRQEPGTLNGIASIVAWSAYIIAGLLVVFSLVGSVANVFLKKPRLFRFCLISAGVSIALSILGIFAVGMTIPPAA